MAAERLRISVKTAVPAKESPLPDPGEETADALTERFTDVSRAVIAPFPTAR